MPDYILRHEDFILITPDDQRPSGEIIERVEQRVNFARCALELCLGGFASKSGEAWFRRAMEAYFFVTLPDPADTPPKQLKAREFLEQFRYVGSQLMELNTHFQSPDLTIRFPIVTAATTDAAAFVPRKMLDSASDLIKTPNPKTKAQFYGEINMFPNKLGTRITGAANLLHEATHLYLGTRDWAYLPNYELFVWEKDIGKRDHQSPNAIKRWYQMSPAEAANNADSYGGFIVYGTEQHYIHSL